MGVAVAGLGIGFDPAGLTTGLTIVGPFFLKPPSALVSSSPEGMAEGGCGSSQFNQKEAGVLRRSTPNPFDDTKGDVG